MTPRQRYRETLLFGNPDRIPLHLGLARESTLAQWTKEGLPEGQDYQSVLVDLLGIDRDALLARHIFEASFKMIPEYEQVTLDHRNGHYLIRDWQGAIVEISDRYDESYLRTKTDFVTRKWHKFPVENRKDWSEMRKRYDPRDPGRLPANFAERCRELRNRESVEMLRVNGVFWQLREWCGLENLSVMMIDDPGFVAEMAEFWADFVMRVFETFLPQIEIDSCFICEDMAYKAHSMISPAMTRQFIQPAYKRWIPFLKSNGCPVIEMDSDGCLDELIPIWMEADANCCSPVEVAAHCDLVDYRRRYGRSMAYLQGIDKRILARGGREMNDHVMTIVPALLKEGGYIPGCDHGVPADVPWKNYVEYSQMLARLCGWL